MSEFLGILHRLQLKYPGKQMPMHCHWWKTLDELKEMAGIQSLPSTISPSSEGLQSESASISPSSEGLQSESASSTESDSEADIGESSQRAPRSSTAATRRGIAGIRYSSDDEEGPVSGIEVKVQFQVRAQGRHEVRPRAKPSTVRRPRRQRRGVKRQSHAQAATSASESEDTPSSSDDGIDHDGGSDPDCSYHPPTDSSVERSNDDDPPVTSIEDEASSINLEDHASESDGIIDLIDTIDGNDNT